MTPFNLKYPLGRIFRIPVSGSSPQANDLNEESSDTQIFYQRCHQLQFSYVAPADGVDKAGVKTLQNGLADARYTSIKRAFTPYPIVDLLRGTIQAETEGVHLVGIYFPQNVVKKVPVGINGDGAETQFAGMSDGGR